jgi:murein DD-endopeptidase MepM/ murein hydrolase activator NlpD
MKLNEIQAGETLELGLGGDGDIRWIRKQRSNGTRLELNGNSADGYSAERIVPEIIEQDRTITATVDTSISDAAVSQNVPYSVIDELVDLFGTRIEFRRDLQKGDTFTIFYSDRKSEFGNDLTPGPITAAAIFNRGHLHVAVRHTGKDGQAHYYDEDGEPLGNFFLRYPVRFSRISSQFSKSRFHPVLKRRRPHNGVDFAAPIGTPVRSVADGIIVSAGYNRGGGNTVKIKHGPRWQTAYLHLNRINRGIRNGVRVTRGQVIGTVGKTGLATGAHLHYSLYDHGRYVDPMKTKLPKMPGKSDPIPKSKLQKVMGELKAAHERMEFARKKSSTPLSDA